MYSINLKYINDSNPGDFMSTLSKVYRGCWSTLDLVKPVLRCYFGIIFLVMYYLTNTLPDDEKAKEDTHSLSKLAVSKPNNNTTYSEED